MGTNTAIGWTDHTFNPWWGCARVSPGCLNCYAEAFAKRTGHGVWGNTTPRRFFGAKHWGEPVKWNAAAEAEQRPHRVFCASMADVFEDRRDLDESRAQLFALIESTPWLLWQLLTKRPENVADLTPRSWWQQWPANAWLGTTVEDQQRAWQRIPQLLAVPAPVRFLSCEPLLGPLDLSAWLDDDLATPPWIGGPPIHWVIVGGESGNGHRPLDLDNARAVCRQVLDAGVPLFFKQVGGRTPTAGGNLIDPHDDGNVQRWQQFPAEVAP